MCRENCESGTVRLRPVSYTHLEKTTFAVPGGLRVVIAVENGEAWFESSCCPDQLCVRSGRLSKTGEAAACLPAGVVLRIEGKAEADAITG